MEYNIVINHKHRKWNNNQNGHAGESINGHGIACYGHFLTDFFINLINIIPYNTTNVILNLKSCLTGDYEINPLCCKEGNIKNSHKMMQNLNEIYPNIKINCNYNNKNLDVGKSYEFLRFCEMDQVMIDERLKNLKTFIKQIQNEIDTDDTLKSKILFIQRNSELVLHPRNNTNASNIFDILQKHLGLNIKRITFENLSFKLQILYCSYAQLIIGCGGSGLFNALFMENNSYIMANSMNCHIFRLLCKYKKIVHLPYFVYNNITNQDQIPQSFINLGISSEHLQKELKSMKFKYMNTKLALLDKNIDITYDSKYFFRMTDGMKHQVGGSAHVFTDYLSAFILSDLFSFKFIHVPLRTQDTKRNMGVSVEDDYFWNRFLNLDLLKNQSDLNQYENIWSLKITKSQWGWGFTSGEFCFCNLNTWLKKLDPRSFPNNNNKILLFQEWARFSIIDLYIEEIENVVPIGTTKKIIQKFQSLFYQKKDYIVEQEKTAVFYVRNGDKTSDHFVLTILHYLCARDYLKKYKIYIISAGSQEQMDKIRADCNKIFPDDRACFLLNHDNVGYIFNLMVSSTILVWNASGFPFLASLYNNKGYMITDNILYNNLVCNEHKNYNIFFDNYLFLNSKNAQALSGFIDNIK